MRTVDVILSPALLPAYDVKNKIAVIIDILRATTSMCVAFKTGVKRILPVATVNEALLFKDFDFVIAAERNAVKVPGFDLGNSPYEFENPLLAGKDIAFTTTNGTKAIQLSIKHGAVQLVVGSFLNLTALCQWLNQQSQDIILVCSGWKDKANIEDTLFAGAVLNKLHASINQDTDACAIAACLFKQNQHDLLQIVRSSNHAKRFMALNLQTDDIAYALQIDTLPIVPILKGNYLLPLKIEQGLTGF
jgi:2-phosphosulfolactate phosphatase